MSDELSLSLLRSFQCIIYGEGANENYRIRKERAFLSYLTVESNRQNSRDALGEMLWLDKLDGYVRMNLRQALSGIRRVVARSEKLSQLFSISDEIVSLKIQNEIEIDFKIFDQIFDSISSHTHPTIEFCPDCISALGELISLYRGDFLDGLLVSNA
jgi:DNA-binding SARP family transcriptional activator